MSKLWERQWWDTDKSYHYFHTYYLLQEPDERSLHEAYRRFRQSQGQPPAKSNDIPNQWENWAAGRDSYGNEQAGAFSWKQRAQAYDDYLYNQEQAKWAERRKQLKEEEWVTGDKLMERARQMLNFMVFERSIDAPGGPMILKPTNWAEIDIGRTVDLAIKLKRRAADMDQGTVKVQVDWRQQLAAAGVDAGELFEKMVNELVNRKTTADA